MAIDQPTDPSIKIEADKFAAQQERAKTYERPEDDPVYSKFQEEITKTINLDVEAARQGQWGTTAQEEANSNYRNYWMRQNIRVSMQKWDDFARQYPDKAQAYQSKNNWISKSLGQQQESGSMDASQSADDLTDATSPAESATPDAETTAADPQDQGTAEQSAIPDKYKGMPSELVEEMWVDPVHVDEETNKRLSARREQALQAIREQEQAREEAKALDSNTRYAGLSDEQKGSFSATRLEASSIIAAAIRGERKLDGLLKPEDEWIINKAQEIYEQQKEENPDASLTIQFEKPLDQTVYANLVNRLTFQLIGEKGQLADQSKANEIRKSLDLEEHPIDTNGLNLVKDDEQTVQASGAETTEDEQENKESQKYQEIANSFPLDEQNPPMPANFVQPIVGNMFGDNDRATLAGKAIAKVYDHLVNREDRTGAYSAEQIIQMGNEELGKFKDYVNESGTNLSVTRKPGETGFHLNGEARRSSRDHLFYFNKSTREWKNPNDQLVRAYLTLGPTEIKNVQKHFVDLCFELNNAGIDFSAKAASPNGFDRRTDNLVFYIAGQDQAKASQMIKDFMKDRGIGEGNVSAAIPSPDQPGLSWAMEVTKEQNSMWQKVSGSSEQCSYNSYVATRAIPYYLRRVSDAHEKLGNSQVAKTFEAEANRVEGITG